MGFYTRELEQMWNLGRIVRGNKTTEKKERGIIILSNSCSSTDRQTDRQTDRLTGSLNILPK